MSEDFASLNLIPRALCEAVEGQKKGERVREREGETNESERAIGKDER